MSTRGGAEDGFSWSTASEFPALVGFQIQLPFSKPRLRWSDELHDKFVSAVNQLGGANYATPKKIWNIMQVEGLTLFQIKSHLQKYRLGMMGKKLPRSDGVVADGKKNVEDELPENEAMDMEGYSQSSSDAFGKKTTAEMTENNNPPLNYLEKDIEWSELLDIGDAVNPVSSHELNSFGSFFDEVAKFPESKEDEFMLDCDGITMGAPFQVNSNVSFYRGF